ncbi:MAG TPA: nuclear transport factor 2 family protein [Dehalococcoidia bacterium]|nr:nuclear transport factor 2 family protein [Dehalococcoidia bacterium]
MSHADREAIYANLRRYCWRLDHADGAGVAATFTRDGVVESTSGRFQNPGGVQQFVAQAATMEGFFGRQHHAQPLLLEQTDEGYLLTSYWMVLTQHVGSTPFLVYNGWYQDTCVLEDGAWRVKKKVIKRWDLETAPIHRPAPP